jgi:hypothetical protein
LTAETGGGTPLAVLMWYYLEDHCRDALDGSAGSFDRFIRWTVAAIRDDLLAIA